MPADHAPDDLLLRRRRDLFRADIAPVAQHADPIAMREDLGHAVADIDDADAARLELRDDPEQLAGLALGQRSGRLVEDQDRAVERQRLGDLDDLLLGDRQFPDQRLRIDLGERGKYAASAVAQRAIIHQPGAPAIGRRHRDVLGDRDVRAERDLLMHQPDAERMRPLRRGDLDGPAIDQDLAAIGPEDTVDNVHQRRLAGSVLAHQRMHLALAEREADTVERTHRAEILADIADFEGEGLHGSARREEGDRRSAAALRRQRGQAYSLMPLVPRRFR